MPSPAPSLCDVCRNLSFDTLLVAPDIEERAEAYDRWERWPYNSMGWNNTEPEERPECPTYDPKEKAGYQLYPSFTSLLKSAENGCELCRAISVEVPRYLAESEKDHRNPFGERNSVASVQWKEFPVQLSFLSDVEKPGAEVWVSLLWRRSEGEKVTYVLAGAFSVWIEPDDPSHSPILSCGRPIPTDPSSGASIQCAKRWFEECRDEHHLCAYGRENSMPKRVIDVGPSDGTEEPRLIETQDPSITWCALSHTWGGKVALTTRMATLEDRKKMIAMSELPQTFRDAITIARRLDIRYLWIDSLCIIQDSELDWISESRRMGAIYKNSILTISATTSDNSEGGILTPRRQRFPPIGVRFHSPRYNFSGLLWIRHVLSPFDHAIEGDESPLNNRGWCLQERVLAPRTLHFGVEQMFWECRTRQEPEGLPSEKQYYGDPDRASIGWEWEANKLYLVPLEKTREVFPDAGQLPEFSKSPPQMTLGYQENPANFSPENGPTRPTGIMFQTNTHGLVPSRLYLSWYGLVENFTSRNLTNSTDKLIAVSGLASEIHKLLDNDTYLAGLWRGDLLNELCWLPHYATECFPSESYRAPSWSWASLDGRVGYPHHHFKRSGAPATPMGAPYDEAEILDVSISSQGPFGPVTEGHLKLKTFFIKIKINAKAYFNKPPPTGMLEQMDLLKAAFKNSYISRSVMSNEDGSVRWVNNRYFKLVIFSEPHPFYNEEEIVPWRVDGNGMVVFEENRFALNPRGKLECTLDRAFDVEKLGGEHGEGPRWFEFLVLRVTARYFLMVMPVEGEEGVYRRIGVAVMGKYTEFSEEVGRRVETFTIV